MSHTYRSIGRVVAGFARATTDVYHDGAMDYVPKQIPGH